MRLTKEREALYLEAVELLKQGLNKTEAAKQVGVNIHSFRGWIYKNYGKTFYSNGGTKLSKEREALYFEAVELTKQQGFTQKEAAIQVGVNYNSFLTWLYKSENKKLRSNRICQHCGVKLDEKCNSKRKYCSQQCLRRATYLRKNPKAEKYTAYKPEFYEKAMEMYLSGVGGAEIAKHFGIPKGTVYGWIHVLHKHRKKQNLDFAIA